MRLRLLSILGSDQWNFSFERSKHFIKANCSFIGLHRSGSSSKWSEYEPQLNDSLISSSFTITFDLTSSKFTDERPRIFASWRATWSEPLHASICLCRGALVFGTGLRDVDERLLGHAFACHPTPAAEPEIQALYLATRERPIKLSNTCAGLIIHHLG